MDEHSQHTNGNGKSSDRETPETMFDSLKIAAGDLAERAAPTVRELSARAAELTATAANKAAPFARKAGAATADASLKLAESARGWAADLRAKEADPANAGDAPTRGRCRDCRGRATHPRVRCRDGPARGSGAIRPGGRRAARRAGARPVRVDRRGGGGESRLRGGPPERRRLERRSPVRLARHLTGEPGRPGRDARYTRRHECPPHCHAW